MRGTLSGTAGPRGRTMALALSIVALLAIFTALQALVPADGFFCGDQGAKYLQAHAFARQGPLDPNIEVASRDLDPAFEHQMHLELHRGRLVSVFSWLLPLVAAPFVAVAGDRGLYVVPALSAIVLFLAAAALGRRLGDGDGLWTAWVVVLTTPIIFYGAELWEHAPAAACVAVAAVLLAPATETDHRASAAGIAIGLGVLFREEAGLALPALIVARMIADRSGQGVKDALAAGALAALGTIAVLLLASPMNLVVYGSLAPVHALGEAEKVTAHPPDRGALAAALLLPARFAGLFLASAAIGAIAAVWSRRRPGGRAAIAVTIAASVTLLVVAIGVPFWRLAILHRPTPDAFSVDSIAHTWPFCVALLLAPLAAVERGSRTASYLAAAGALIVAGALLVVPSTGGAQWGPRYLLIAAPLLAAVAARPARHASTWPAPRAAAAIAWTARIVLLCAVAAQAYGLWFLYDNKTRNGRIVHRLAELTTPDETVITDIAWMPEIAAPLVPTRRMLLARSPDEVAGLARTAAAHGMHQIAVVASTGETGFFAPGTIGTAAGCTFTRIVRLSLGERGLILHRYSCGAGVVLK